MVLRQIIYGHGSSRFNTKDLNKICNWHGLVKSYMQQMTISRKIINSQGSSKIKTKYLNKIFH